MFTTIPRVALVASVVVSSATLATGSVLVARSAASAAGYIFTSIDVPGASQTFATGINDAGQIVGPFVDLDGAVHGFVKSALDWFLHGTTSSL